MPGTRHLHVRLQHRAVGKAHQEVLAVGLHVVDPGSRIGACGHETDRVEPGDGPAHESRGESGGRSVDRVAFGHGVQCGGR